MVVEEQQQIKNLFNRIKNHNIVSFLRAQNIVLTVDEFQ